MSQNKLSKRSVRKKVYPASEQNTAKVSKKQREGDDEGFASWLQPVEDFVEPALLQNGTVSDEYVASFLSSRKKRM